MSMNQLEGTTGTVKTFDPQKITFFRPTERGLRSADIKEYKIVFTEKPKGIRMNAFMARRLTAHNVKYVEIGITPDNKLIIKPSTTKDGAFSLAGTKSSMQISASEVFAWAESMGLTNKKVVGHFDPSIGAYVFDVSKSTSDDVDDSEDDENVDEDEE